METISPKDNHYLIGHETAENMILKTWQNHTLPHALLITGPKGIGKATLAYKIARFLLSADEKQASQYKNLDVSPNSEVFRQISTFSHPDFRLLEKNYIKTDRQKIYKAISSGNYMSDEELKNLKKSNEIVVEDVRKIHDFLAKRSAYDNWRVVIVDSADDMNSSSANALLKTLEEPPHKTLLILISNNVFSLLPTIRSRCTKIELSPLSQNNLCSLLRRYRPQTSENAIKQISSMSKGSIGKAIMYNDYDAIDFYSQIEELTDNSTNFNIKSMLDFCTFAASNERYDLFPEMLEIFIAKKIRQGQHVEEYASLLSQSMEIFKDVEIINMDKKQAILNIMVKLTKI